MIQSLIFSFIIPLIFILLVNWCAIKKEEYPDIKINKFFKTGIIIFGISIASNIIFILFKDNIFEQLIFNTVLCFLFPLSYIDWKTSLIPNRLSTGIFIVGIFTVIYNYFNQNNPLFFTFDEQILSFLLISISFVLVYFICKGGIGFGDVKLISSLALFINISSTLLVLFISSAIIVIYNAIVSLLYKNQISSLPNNEISLSDEEEKIDGRILGISIINGKPSIVMGPFIAIGFIIAIIFSTMFFNWLY